MRHIRGVLAAGAVVLVLVVGAMAVRGSDPGNGAPTVTTRPWDVSDDWVVTAGNAVVRFGGSWGADLTYADGFDDQTLRQGLHTTVGGSAARVVISNRLGTRPLVVGAASVGVPQLAASDRATLVPDSMRALTVDGRPAFTVAEGEVVITDPVELAVPADHDLSVSLWITEPSGAPNGTVFGAQTSHRAEGNLAMKAGGRGFGDPQASVSFISAVEVLAGPGERAVVVLGDSKTDGFLAVGTDTQQRWTDVVRERMVADGHDEISVINAGSAGNQLLPASGAPWSGLGRLDADVLDRAGVATVVVAMGTNDIVTDATAEEIVAGLRTVIDRVKAAGMRVVGTTIPPITGPRAVDTCAATVPPEPRREVVRAAVNAYIRPGTDLSLPFDGVIDVDEMLRDPFAPSQILCEYALNLPDSEPNAHPNISGHRAVGEAVDLRLLLG